MVYSIPPVPPASGINSLSTPSLLDAGSVAIDILSFPTVSSNSSFSTRLRGEITQIDRNGTLTITTHQGDVTVRLQDQVRVDRGQQVEIEFSPNKNSKSTPSATLVATPPEPKTPQAQIATLPPSTLTDPVSIRPPDPDTVNDAQQRELNINLRDLALREITNREMARQIPLDRDQIIQIRQISIADVVSILKNNSPSIPISTRLIPFLSSSPLAQDVIGFSNFLKTPFNPRHDLIDHSFFTINTTENWQSNDRFQSQFDFSFLSSPRISLENPKLTHNFEIFNFITTPEPPEQFPLPGIQQMRIINIINGQSVFLSHENPNVAGSQAISFHPLTSVNFSPSTETATTSTLMVWGQDLVGHTILTTQTTSPFYALNTLHLNQPAPIFYLVGALNTPLTPGSLVTVSPVTIPTHLGQNTANLNLSDDPLSFILDDLLQSLSPAVRNELFGATNRPVMPQINTPNQMGAALFFFIAALRSGDLTGWLGERTIDLIRRQGSNKGASALDQLTNLFGTTKERQTEMTTGEWRSYPVPIAFDQHMISARFHTQYEHDEGENAHQKNAPKGQRFILDLKFDRIGAVQMDMLYRPQQLDSILRTELPLSKAMRGVLETRYAGAMGKTNLTGTLHFQDGRATWVTIQPRTQDDVHITA